MSSKIGRVQMAAGALLLAGMLLAACAEEAKEEVPQEGTVVNMVMKETEEEWIYEMDRTEVPAGLVTFEAVNEGEFEHELMIYPMQDISHLLEEAVEAAKAGGEAHVGEEIEGLVFSVEGEEELLLEPGQSGTFTVELTPGTYELGCLIVETVGGETFTHHEKGMRATLTVQ